jgi:methionyl-tRNA synthetase
VLASDRTRSVTILHVALRCIDNVKLLLTPFLPHSSQRLHRLLGHEGWLAGPLELRDVVEPDGDVHTVLTGEYDTWVGRWEPSRLEPGQALRQSSPLFAKLDRATVVRAELERMGRTAS